VARAFGKGELFLTPMICHNSGIDLSRRLRMANPFPGMNPFLELPSRWQSFHQRFITYLADTIDSLLPDNYSADFGERVYVATPPKGMYPDVFVVKHGR
jgi:hypothetical protein